MAGWSCFIHHVGFYPAASFEALGLGLGRLPAVADQPQMEAEGWNPVVLAACWQRQVQVRIGLAPTATCLLPPTPGVWLPERCSSPRSNSLAAVSPPVPVRRACCSRIGMPCSGTPDIAQGSRSFCGTAECIQDASLDDGCWLVAVSFFPYDPSRTRR